MVAKPLEHNKVVQKIIDAKTEIIYKGIRKNIC